MVYKLYIYMFLTRTHTHIYLYIYIMSCALQATMCELRRDNWRLPTMS